MARKPSAPLFIRSIGLGQQAVVYGLQLALSAWLAFAIASFLRIPNPFWAAIPVFVVTKATRGLAFAHATKTASCVRTKEPVNDHIHTYKKNVGQILDGQQINEVLKLAEDVDPTLTQHLQRMLWGTHWLMTSITSRVVSH